MSNMLPFTMVDSQIGLIGLALSQHMLRFFIWLTTI